MKIKTAVFGAAALLALYLVWQAKQTATKIITQDLNPASDKNLAYTALDKLGDAVSGDSTGTPGTRLFDALNSDWIKYTPIGPLLGKYPWSSNKDAAGRTPYVVATNDGTKITGFQTPGIVPGKPGSVAIGVH